MLLRLSLLGRCRLSQTLSRSGLRNMCTRVPRPLIMEFYKKVHPDLFVENEYHRRVNQDSLASLNSLLDYATALKENPYARPPAAQMLSFFVDNGVESASGPKLKLVQVEFKPVSGRDVFPSLDRCLFDLFKAAGIEVPADIPLAAEEEKPTGERSRRRREMARKEREAAEAAEQERKERQLIFGRKLWKSRRLTEPRFCLVPAMIKSGLILYSSKLLGWQKTRCILKFTDAVNAYYKEMKCVEWTGCKIFFHDQPEFFEPTDGVFLIPWDFKTERLIRYFGETSHMAIDENRTVAGIEANENEKEEEDDAMMDPQKIRAMEEAFAYFTTPEREKSFDSLMKTTILQAAKFRNSPEETEAISDILSHATAT